MVARRAGNKTASNSMFVSLGVDEMFLFLGAQAGTFLRPARVRAMIVFMICAVPSPI